MFSENIIDFYSNLENTGNLPPAISALNPYESSAVLDVVTVFYKKYYADNTERIYMVGINPGRFGGGITGISFTDPINLEERCRVKNNFAKRHELSSKFIYKLIETFGGEKHFFSAFFLTALYPFALIKDGKNYNYYEDSKTWEILKPEILKMFEDQLNAGASRKSVICLGKKNEKYLREINNELNFFEKIITFEHPRYIMQYKLKSLDYYLNDYARQLKMLIN